MLSFYFSPYGRIGRKDFWLKFVLVYVGMSVASVLVDSFFFPDLDVTTDTGPVEMVTNLVWLWPQLALTTKRFHDRNMSGWWQILFNVVIAGAAVFAISGMMDTGFDPEVIADPSVLTPLLIGGGICLAAGITELVILGFLPGTKGRNKYGDDPLGPPMKNVADVFS